MWLMIILLIIIFATTYWFNAMRAKERAVMFANKICKQAKVDLLDETVCLHKLSLRRNENGRLSICRRYQFDYSYQSHRLQGHLTLLGQQCIDYATSIQPSDIRLKENTLDQEADIIVFKPANDNKHS